MGRSILGDDVLERVLAGEVTEEMTFNQRVWAECVRIPRGKVTTYAAIARRLGTNAYRAVGNALNKNPYAPRVPCHRVVGSDGSLTGYAGGVPKKRRMLEAEGVIFVKGRADLDRCGWEVAIKRETGKKAKQAVMWEA